MNKICWGIFNDHVRLPESNCFPSDIEDIPWTTPDCWANLVVSKIPFGPALLRQMRLSGWCLFVGEIPHIFRVKARLRCRREQVFFLIWISESWFSLWYIYIYKQYTHIYVCIYIYIYNMYNTNYIHTNFECGRILLPHFKGSHDSCSDS